MEKDFISNLFSIITAGMFYSLLYSSSENVKSQAQLTIYLGFLCACYNTNKAQSKRQDSFHKSLSFAYMSLIRICKEKIECKMKNFLVNAWKKRVK